MMPKCNIDQRGRMFRFFGGLLIFFLGSVFFIVAMPGDGIWWRTFQVGMMLLGVFLMYEGIMGWCLLRAMGFKTRF